MVYLYKKLIGGKPYYYLRVSEMKGSRTIVKDIAYLGSSIDDVKKSLEKMPALKDKIRKAYRNIHNFLESNHFLEKAHELKLAKSDFLGEKIYEIEACRMHFSERFNKNDGLTKKEIWKNFVAEFVFNTSSIEGNTISLAETINLLSEGLTPKNKTLREIYDMQNSERVFFELLECTDEISHNFIINTHAKLMENIDSRKGYRNADVRVFRAEFKATPFPYIKADMGILLKWHDDNKKILHPLALAVIFHHKFEKIHPFMDGNGRTGRMLLNYILLREGYPPAIIMKKHREKYLKALRKADKSDLTHADAGNYSDIVQFAAEEMIESYWNLFL